MTFTEIWEQHRTIKVNAQIDYKLWRIALHLRNDISTQAEREINDQIYFRLREKTIRDYDE